MTFNQLRDLAQIMESADQQANKMENRQEETEPVHFVSQLSNQLQGKSQAYSAKQQKCYACGYNGHIKSDLKCLAKSKS